MENSFKFTETFDCDDHMKGHPVAESTIELCNKLKETVNGGNYKFVVVLNALSNLFTIVAVSAIMTGRLSAKDFLNYFKNSFVSSFKQIAPHVRHDDTDEIVKQMKDSAGLK